MSPSKSNAEISRRGLLALLPGAVLLPEIPLRQVQPQTHYVTVWDVAKRPSETWIVEVFASSPGGSSSIIALDRFIVENPNFDLSAMLPTFLDREAIAKAARVLERHGDPIR